MFLWIQPTCQDLSVAKQVEWLRRVQGHAVQGHAVHTCWSKMARLQRRLLQIPCEWPLSHRVRVPSNGLGGYSSYFQRWGLAGHPARMVQTFGCCIDPYSPEQMRCTSSGRRRCQRYWMWMHASPRTTASSRQNLMAMVPWQRGHRDGSVIPPWSWVFLTSFLLRRGLTDFREWSGRVAFPQEDVCIFFPQQDCCGDWKPWILSKK